MASKPPLTTTTTASPPPSSSSSPSHEFSFTISFHPSPPTSTPKALGKGGKKSSAIDLAPADDIFFHGHLLPLHLLHPPPLPTTPRLSNLSADNVPCIPIANTITIDQNPTNNHTNNNNNNKSSAETKEKIKPKPFYSFFAGLGRWRREDDDEDEDEKNKMKKEKEKKKRFDVSRIWKRYATAVESLLLSRGSKEKRDLRRRPYSFSGNSNWKGREEWIERRRKKWGQFSAPVSMRTSPTNSSILAATAGTTTCGSSDESTMEELQNAIQAAIAHCKNSIAMEEGKCKCS